MLAFYYNVLVFFLKDKKIPILESAEKLINKKRDKSKTSNVYPKSRTM
jgi:hypothetical protein